MWIRDNIQQELNEVLPALAGIPNSNVYTVQANYFLEFPVKVMQSIQADGLSSIMHQSTKAQPYQAPADYFENFAHNVLAKIKVAGSELSEVDAELQNIAPGLLGLNRKQVYHVPAGYFNTFNPVVKPVRAKVVSMYSVSRMMKYVAAAVVIAIMAISAYLFLEPAAPATMASTESTLNITASVKTLSEEEIVEYLQTHSTTLNGTLGSANLPDTEADFNEVIDELTDEELQQFLKQFPEPVTKTNKNI